MRAASSAVRPEPVAQPEAEVDRWRVVLPFLIGPIMIVAATLSWAMEHGTQGLATAILRNSLVYGVGVGGVVAALVHALRADRAGRSGADGAQGPFEFEVAMAHLGLGVLGLSCAWQGGGFWAATIAMTAVFGLGSAVGHVREIVDRRHGAKPADGFVVVWEMLLPAGLIALAISS